MWDIHHMCKRIVAFVAVSIRHLVKCSHTVERLTRCDIFTKIRVCVSVCVRACARVCVRPATAAPALWTQTLSSAWGICTALESDVFTLLKWKIASDEIKRHVIFYCCLGQSLHQRWTSDMGSHNPVHRLMHSDMCQVESARSDLVRDFRRNLCRKVTGAPVRVRSRRVRGCCQINGKGLHVWKGLCCWQFATLPLLAV